MLSSFVTVLKLVIFAVGLLQMISFLKFFLYCVPFFLLFALLSCVAVCPLNVLLFRPVQMVMMLRTPVLALSQMSSLPHDNFAHSCLIDELAASG